MDGDVRRALRLFDREAEHLAPADLREVALFGIAVGDPRDVGETDGTAIADRQPRFAELVGVFRIPEHAHRLLAARDFGAAARGVDIHLHPLLVHLAGGPAITLHPRGIQDPAAFGIDAPRTRT